MCFKPVLFCKIFSCKKTILNNILVRADYFLYRLVKNFKEQSNRKCNSSCAALSLLVPVFSVKFSVPVAVIFRSVQPICNETTVITRMLYNDLVISYSQTLTPHFTPEHCSITDKTCFMVNREFKHGQTQQTPNFSQSS